MATIKKLLPYQSAFLQAPLVYKNIRYFMLVTGYGAGKTSSLIDSLNYDIARLQGKRDREGRSPLLMLCGVTLTFMKRTCVHDWLQSLDNSHTLYNYHKDINQVEIGDVTVVLQSCEDPSQIYGINCLVSNTKIIVKRNNKLKEVKISKVKVGDNVLTRKGFRPVSKVLYRGKRKVNTVTYGKHKVICTPDHKIFDTSTNSFISSNNLTNSSRCATLLSEVNTWNNLKDYQTKLLSLMEFIITLHLKGIMNVPQNTERKAIQAYTEITTFLALVKFQRGMSYITKTTTELIMKLVTLYVSKIQHTRKIIGLTQKEKTSKLKLLKNVLQIKSTNVAVRFVELSLVLSLQVQSIAQFLVKKKERKEKDKRTEFYNLSQEFVQNVVKSLQQQEEELLDKNSVQKNVKELTRRRGIRNAGQIKNLKFIQKLVLFVDNLLQQTIQQQNVALNTVPTLSVGKLSRREKKVYDISVEEEHEFYGNGLLLHNCYAQYFDEADELSTEVCLEAVRSLNERLRQQLIGERPPYAKWTTTSQGKKGLYRTVLQFKQGGIPYMIIRGRTCDNIYLPKEYIQAMYAMYNEKEKQCYLEGQFVSVDSNMVFPDYDPARNDLSVDLWDSIEPTDTIYIGQDFNTNNNNATACVIKYGCMIFIKDYVFSDIRRAPEVYRYDFPNNPIIWIPDMTYKEHFGEFAKELRANKIKIAYRACNPNVNDRIFATNKLLFTERLFICPICTELKKSLATHQRDPKTGKPMKGSIGAADHMSDALTYVTHYLLTWNKEFKDVYDITLGRKAKIHEDPSTKMGNLLLDDTRILKAGTYKHTEGKQNT